MPKTDVALVRAQRGTIALFAAAAVLAAIGVALFLGIGDADRSGAPHSAPRTAMPSATTGSSSGSADPATASPVTEPTESPAAAVPSQLPAPMQEAARAFTTAWASHDARPGHDSAYGDASRRAAALADGDLADDLRSHTSGSAGGRQWQDWKDRQVQVTVTVLRVSLPDGAPAPTEDSGFARVLYKLTETPASGPAVASEEHVALKLRRTADGSWRVVGLPNV